MKNSVLVQERHWIMTVSFYPVIKKIGNYSVDSIPRGVLACFFAKIPRHTRQNAITEGDFECILTRNCEGTE